MNYFLTVESPKSCTDARSGTVLYILARLLSDKTSRILQGPVVICLLVVIQQLLLLHIFSHPLLLFKTRNVRLFQTEGVCRRQFQI